MGLGEVFKLFATLGIDATEFDAGLAGAEQKLNATAQAFSGAGRTLTMGVTAPIVGLGTAALHSSISFESAFAGVRKTVDATEEEFAMLEQGIRDMTTRIPASAEEIARVAEAAGQLGVQTEDILSFTEVMIGLGEATADMMPEEAAMQVARFMNIMQTAPSDVTRLASTVVDLGNNLAATEGEITLMGMRLAGAGNLIGLTEAETLGLAGAMTSLGIRAEAGGTAMSRVMREIMTAVMDGGEDLTHFANTAGVTTDEFAAAFAGNPITAIQLFSDGLGRIRDEGGNVNDALETLSLNDIRVSDALLRMSGAGDLLTQSINLATNAWEENTALQEEVGRRYETTESQLQMAKNSMQEVVRTLGDALVPLLLQVIEAAKPLIGALQSLAEWFGNLDPTMQGFIVGGLGILAALGPVLWMIGSFAGAISNLLPLLRMVPGLFAGIRTAIGLLTGPVGWIITAVGLLVAAWTTDFLGLRTRVLEGWQRIKDAFALARDFLQGVGDNIVSGFRKAGETLGAVFRGDWETVKNNFRASMESWWNGLNNLLGGFPARMLEHGRNIVNGIRDGAQSVFGSVRDFFQSRAEGLMSKLSTAFTTGWEDVKGVFSRAKDFLAGVGNGVRDNMSAMAGAIRSLAAGDFQGAFNQVRDIFKGWWDNLNEFLGGLPQAMLDFGKDLIGGLIDGVKSMITGAVDAVKGVGENIISGFKGLLGIESPSKVFYGFGVDIGEGLAQGIESSEGRVEEAVEGLTKRVFKASGAFDPAGLAAALTSGLAEKDAIAAIRARLSELTGQRDHVMEHYGSNRFKNVALGFINPQIEALNDELARLRQELVTTRNHTAREGEAQTRRFSMAVTTFGADVRSLTLAKQRY